MITPKTLILRDLLISRSTADSIAPRVRLHPDAVAAILTRLLKDGTVTATPLAGLIIYQLTPATHQSLTDDLSTNHFFTSSLLHLSHSSLRPSTFYF